MQPTLHIFQFQKRPVRVLVIDGQPWFIARDVCERLGLEQVSRAMSKLDPDEGGLQKIPHPQNPMKTILANAVTEPGLYQLIQHSTKPEAHSFRRWVAHEVLPAIRATGSYHLHTLSGNASPLSQFTRRDLLNLAVAAEDECEKLRDQVAELGPKAEFYDRVVDSTSTFSMAETAKMLKLQGMGRNNLIRFLRQEGILMSDNVALQRYIDRGYFIVIQKDFAASDGGILVKAVTRVTEKGVDFIRQRLDERFRQMTGQAGSLCATGTDHTHGSEDLIFIRCHGYVRRTDFGE